MIKMVCMTKKIRFKTTMLNAGLCDYSDTYILVEGRITVAGKAANNAEIAAGRNNKKIVTATGLEPTTT